MLWDFPSVSHAPFRFFDTVLLFLSSVLPVCLPPPPLSPHFLFVPFGFPFWFSLLVCVLFIFPFGFLLRYFFFQFFMI